MIIATELFCGITIAVRMQWSTSQFTNRAAAISPSFSLNHITADTLCASCRLFVSLFISIQCVSDNVRNKLSSKDNEFYVLAFNVTISHFQKYTSFLPCNFVRTLFECYQ